jgi:hypothetical protein
VVCVCIWAGVRPMGLLEVPRGSSDFLERFSFISKNSPGYIYNLQM